MYIRGTAIIIMLTVFLCGRPAQADLCDNMKPREIRINIDIIIPEPYYDLSKSKRQLTRDAREITEAWVKKHQMDVLWKADDLSTAGLASGAQALMYEAVIKAEPVDRYGAAYCTYFKEITIAVFYRTMILIPQEYPQGTCAFEDINRHELRHHEANRKAVEKYIRQLKQDIHQLVDYMEGAHIPRNQVEARYEEMKLGMRDAIQVYAREYVRQEMEERNGLIDTPEEYKRSSVALRACKKKDGHRPPR